MMSAHGLTSQEESELLSLCADSTGGKHPDVGGSNNIQGAGGLVAAIAADNNDSNTANRKRPKQRKSEVHSKKNMRNMSDDELFIEFDKDLKTVSEEETCYSQGPGTCTCLHILRKPHLRATVAKYKVGLAKKSKHEIDTIIFEWYRYAKASADEKAGRHKPNWYMIPFDGTDALANNIDIKEIVFARMCQQAMFRVMGITESRFTSIRQASITGVVPRHASTGKRSPNATSDDARAIVVEHFQNLCQQLGVVENRVSDDVAPDIQLPLPYSARACYRIYLKALGYSVKYSTNGSANIEWDGDDDDEKPKYISATTYFTFWKNEFPYLKAAVDPRGAKNQNKRNGPRKAAQTRMTPRREGTNDAVNFELSMEESITEGQTETV